MSKNLTPEQRAKYFTVERFIEAGTSYRYRVRTTFDVTQNHDDIEGIGYWEYSPPRNLGKVTCCRSLRKSDAIASLNSGRYDWYVFGWVKKLQNDL